MPIYVFENQRTKEHKEVFQKMREKHIYSDESDDEWRRIWTTSQLTMDSLSEIDPYDSKAFAKKTGEKQGTYGDLFTASKELSEKRKARNGGFDPIQQKYFNNYAKKRKGKRHRLEKLQNLKTSLDKKGIEIEI